MDKLSRFWPGLDDLHDVEIPQLSCILEDLLDSGNDEASLYNHDEDDEDEDEEGATHDYNSEFGLSMPEVYMGHEQKRIEKEYNGHGKDMAFNKFGERPINKAEDPEKEESLRLGSDFRLTGGADKAEYRDTIIQAYSDGMMKGLEVETSQPGLLNIEYETPELINGQRTYQRMVLEADAEGETVYDMTMRKLVEVGIEVSASYDFDFDTMIFTSINQKKEGTAGNFNEFYLNGEIGESAVDKQKLKKGDVIEWRYAEESDGSCGGVPDFHRVKNLLQQYNGMGNAYDGHQGAGMINPFSNTHLLGTYGGIIF